MLKRENRNDYDTARLWPADKGPIAALILRYSLRTKSWTLVESNAPAVLFSDPFVVPVLDFLETLPNWKQRILIDVPSSPACDGMLNSDEDTLSAGAIDCASFLHEEARIPREDIRAFLVWYTNLTLSLFLDLD